MGFDFFGRARGVGRLGMVGIMIMIKIKIRIRSVHIRPLAC